ncbi:hypothetical protein BGZ83_005302 [Gryganskiella cystojenkinii]|nr:hypothetical protein BGZ83_005302 [Gryganskiella cystojenkinii]
MADIVVYEDSPLAQYLNDIQGEQQGGELQHSTVPIHDPDPLPASISTRLTQNAVGMLTHLVELISHTFSSSASDSEDAEFEERFKYFICTSPFLNKNATLHTHERGRRTDTTTANLLPMTIEFATKLTPGRFGYALGFGTLAALIARSVIARTRIGRIPWMKPFLGRTAAFTLAFGSTAWMLRILRRKKIQTTQSQALRSLQILVDHCQSLDAKVNRAIMVIQEIELVSRGYRLSTPLAPISRIEQASKTRRCNLVRAQLVAALAKSGALFQKSTETLQSHIDHKRLSTLLDMYNITPSPRPNSPGEAHGTEYLNTQLTDQLNDHQQSNLILTDSPTSDQASPPLPSSYVPLARQNSTSYRRARTATAASTRNSRPSSYHDPSTNAIINTEHQRLVFGRRPARRTHTSWSASEGEESDSGSVSFTISPRSSTYSNPDGSSPTMSATLGMTTLERLRKKFQRMHGYRREFLCELLSIRRKSRKGHQGLNALKDYDRNWTVVRDVLQEGVTGIQSVVDELNKVLDAELYTLPRIDTQGDNRTGASPQDKRMQPFVHRLALLEQHVRGVQAKLYICNEDIKDVVRQEPTDTEKQRLLELQYDSIHQDIGMMAQEWQLGKTALGHVLDPSSSTGGRAGPSDEILEDEQNLDSPTQEGQVSLEPITDALEQLEDHQRLVDLASKREEVFEASTESELDSMLASRRAAAALTGSDGITPMTRAERIQHQKKLREDEEQRKERVYDNSKMVHELKNVLGRRRHLREHDDPTEEGQDQDPEQEQVIIAASSSSSSARPYSLEPTRTQAPTEFISPFTLSRPVFSHEEEMTEEYSTTVADSYVEISGVGEAEEQEENVEISGFGEAENEEDEEVDQDDQDQNKESRMSEEQPSPE